MTRRDAEFDTTRTECDPSGIPALALPVLIVIGDARTLGASRAVIRIKGSLEIGRRPDATADRAWTIEDDRVSRRHAVVRVDSLRGTAEITDLGSRNGTIVDGQPLADRTTQLAPGSLIFVGPFAAIFRFASESDLKAIEEELATPLTPVATTSPELARKSRIIRHLAKAKEDLLIVGETGVGKEQFARAIHRASGRPGEFVAVNCPALPGTLIESELFGYVKGAHSQAARDKSGLIDEAEGGTLFLDEFAEISQEVQAKLLRFLEEKDFQPLGATKPRHVDVRVLAATNRELSALRQDITARLGPEPIRLPALRNHPEDIGALASYFLRQHPELGMEVAAFQMLCLHDWPDNVRGLRKTLLRAAQLATAHGDPLIGPKHLPENFGRKAEPPPSPSSLAETVRSAPGRRSPRAAPTRTELEALLARNEWVVSKAAREIDRDHAVVWRWIKRYGLDTSRARQ
jgi:transcriptional regulator with PAS, ATPase and Fis domain